MPESWYRAHKTYAVHIDELTQVLRQRKASGQKHDVTASHKRR
jgi:hypothetical protein